MKVIFIMSDCPGRFKVSTMFRGKLISTRTNNTQAIDRYRDTDIPAKARGEIGMTRAQAGQSLYNEIVRNTNSK